MQLSKLVPPALLSLAVVLAGSFLTAPPVGARAATEVAEASDSASPSSEEEEDTAEDQMLEKADVAAAVGAMEAHLRAGKEVLAAGEADEAEALFARARDLLSPEMIESLTESGVPSLTEPLAATAKGDAAAVDAAIAALAAAREGVGAGVPDKTRYLIKAAVALLYYAMDEYRGWINDPGAGTVVDYQGARGVAMLAATILEPLKPEVARLNQESADGIATSLAAILRAFSGTAPPAKPVVLEGDMSAMINAINEFSEGF